MKAKEISDLTTAEIEQNIKSLKEELFNLRFQKATGQLTNNQRVGAVKRDIARIYTVLRERELGLSVVPEAEA